MLRRITTAGLMSAWLASAMPTSPNLSLNLRQSDQPTAACTGNICDDCPFTFSLGSGFPQCLIYTTDDLASQGFPVDETGLVQIFMSIPPLDDQCQVLIRTPVTGTADQCGGNTLVAQGATCAPVRVDTTFMAMFCCGVDDCAGAGAPSAKRGFGLSSSSAASGSGLLLLQDQNGNIINPISIDEYNAREAAKVTVAAAEAAEIGEIERRLSKRDCGEFVVTRGPYAADGPNNIVSDQVGCGPTQGCDATLGGEVSQTTSFSVEVSVGDPLGIVSASTGFEYSESMSRSFSGTYQFGPGERGYVVFIPILRCYDGYFTGDCDDNEVATTVCGPTEASGEMNGILRGVLIRG